MKACIRVALLTFLLPVCSPAASEIEAELGNYEGLSRSIQQRVAKIERNARACYKNLPVGYQAMVQARGVFGMFEAGRKSLESNRIAVKDSFETLHLEIRAKPDTSGINACEGGASAASTNLAANKASVSAARARLAKVEPGLKSAQKSVSNPSDRANIEYLINCGDPTALRNFHTALDEFNRLVRSHDSLSVYLASQEASLANGTSTLLASVRKCGVAASLE
jgi:hypothetical protein